MILKGGIPGIKCGKARSWGVTFANLAVGGDQPSPLANDADLGDSTTEFLWALQPPLVASGTTSVTDNGGYSLVGAATGTWTQSYTALFMPATGAPSSGVANIVTTVGPLVTAPRITQQPTGLSLLEGQTAAFAVQASGSEPLAIQWRKDGVPISGATSPGYSLTAQLADNGAAFTALVSNTGGQVLSNAAVLLVATDRSAVRRPRRLYVAAEVRRLVWS
jgi:hypothetical protein